MSTRVAWMMVLAVTFCGTDRRIALCEEKGSPVPGPAATSAVPDKLGQATTRKTTKPKELCDAVKKGLEYLVGQQHENGGFGQGGGWRLSGEGGSGRLEGNDIKDPPDMGNTCVAALTLFRAGNTPKDGKYSKQLLKAIEFIETLVEEADKDSLYVTPIRDTQLQSKIGHYVDTFLTALVLSELKGQMPDKKSEDRLFAALNKTIGKIEANQQADGTFVGNSGWASVLSQGLCSKALSRASQKGVAVKSETLKRDLDQSVAQLSTTTPGVTTAVDGPGVGRAAALGSAKGDAGVELYSLAANGGRVQDTVNANQIRKKKATEVVSSPTADAKTKEEAKLELKEVEEAEVVNAEATSKLMANLGETKFLRGFGNNGGEEFLSYMNISETLFAQGGEAWEKWDRQVSETVSKVQNEDGSWSGHHCITGRTFCTASALLTMMADRTPLPELQDKTPTAK